MNENDKKSKFINQIMTYINADNKTVFNVLGDKVILITGKLLNYEYRSDCLVIAIEPNFTKELLRNYIGEDIGIMAKVKE